MKSFWITLLIVSATSSISSQHIYHRTLKLMGSRFDITVVAEDSLVGNNYIDLAIGEITRIEKLISSWDAQSQTSKINRKAGVNPVEVDPELYGLIDRAIHISQLTDGAFDISYASMDKIWKFDGSLTEMPDAKEIKASVERVGFHHIKLEERNKSVFLKLPGMKIGFGAIGKGYAADRAKQLLLEHGVAAGIINASGDMSTWGKQVSGEAWKVAITNPLNKDKAYALLPIEEGAVVTSGNYEKYVTIDGRRYAHIIDPRTGYPCTGIISATVFAPKAELADALATATFVMGIEVGLDLINQLPKIECIIIDEDGKVHISKNVEIEKL